MPDRFERVGADLIVRDFSRAGVSTFQKNMRLIQGEVLGIRRTLATAFGIGAGYLGFQGLVQGYKSAIKAATDAAESDNLFRVSMGQTGAAAERWSKELSAALGLSETAVRRNVATMKLMTESMGVTESDAVKMGEAMTQLAYDISSFRNIPAEEAFQKLQAGISGETEPLKRLGVLVNETSVQEYALRQGWIQHGQQLSEVGKVYARFGLIMQQTAKDQGDLYRTGDSAANVQRRIQAQMEALRIQIGQALLPSYQKAMQGISGYLQTNLDDVRSWAEGTVSVTNAVIQAYGKIQRAFATAYERTMGRSVLTQAARERYGQMHPEDVDAFSQKFIPGGFGGAVATQGPRFPADYQRILDELRAEQEMVIQDREAARLERVKLSGQYPDVNMPERPEPPAYPDVKPADRAALAQGRDEEAKATAKATDAVRSHFAALDQEREIIGRLNESRFRAQDYVEVRRAIAALDEKEVNTLLAEMRARQAVNDLTIQQTALLREYEDQLLDLRRAEMISQTMDDLSKTLMDIAFDFRNAEEAAASFLNTLARNVVQQNIMQPFTDALGGGLRNLWKPPTAPTPSGGYVDPGSGINTVTGQVGHRGGRIGRDYLPTRRVPAAVFAGAPRMKTGGWIGPGEVPIIAHRGETILAEGAKLAPKVNLNITNQTSTPVESGDMSYDVDPSGMVVNMLLRDHMEGGPSRDYFGGR